MGGKLFLDRNENSYGPSPLVAKAIQDLTDSDLFRYGQYHASELRSKIATYFRVSEKNIMLGYGAEGLLTYFFDSLVDQRSIVAVPEFHWRFYDAQINRKGARKLLIPMYKEESTFRHDLENICRTADISIITNPNMPTGAAIPVDDILKVARTSNNNQTTLIDETYWGFTTLKPSHEKQVVESPGRVAIIRSFSKVYALAGLRIGFAILSDRLCDDLDFNEPFLGYNIVNERAGIAALEDVAHYESISKKIEKAKTKLSETMSKNGWTPYDSKANFVLCELPPEEVGRVRDAFDKSDITIRFIEDSNTTYIRVSIGKDEENSKVIKLLEGLRNGF